MRYGSICSGIEAATAAWHPLGWFRDRTGQTYGRLTAIRPAGRSTNGSILWLCGCTCQGQIVCNPPAADGPRYAAIGNSMAVPVMRYIGERINMIETRGLAHQESA